MANKPKYDTREKWLLEAVALATPIFETAGYKVPKNIRVACGWPSSRGLSKKHRAVGECWSPESASDKAINIFVSPFLSNPEKPDDVFDTLIHEIVHATVGNKEHHNKVFMKCARAVGLTEGKPTDCSAGKELMAKITELMKVLGPYPHGTLDRSKSPVKKQTTRLIKCECGKCEYTARVTRKWLEFGAPICPLKGHGPMTFDESVLEGDDDE